MKYAKKTTTSLFKLASNILLLGCFPRWENGWKLIWWPQHKFKPLYFVEIEIWIWIFGIPQNHLGWIMYSFATVDISEMEFCFQCIQILLYGLFRKGGKGGVWLSVNCFVFFSKNVYRKREAKKEKCDQLLAKQFSSLSQIKSITAVKCPGKIFQSFLLGIYLEVSKNENHQ